MKYRIIYFLDSPFGIGGSSKVLLTQAYIMKERGFEVKIVIPVDGKGKYVKEYDIICREYDLNFVTAHYPVAICMENIDIVAALKAHQEIVELIRNYNPDIIHSVQINIAVELAARELSIPHLMNVYQADKQEFVINWMKVYPQYHSSDSQFFSQRWKEGLFINSRCIRVAYKSKEKIEKNEKWVKETKTNLLAIGVLCEHKNQIEIIKFVQECLKNGLDVNLMLLGECKNNYGHYCERYVRENGLQKNVIFKGFVSKIENYMYKADLFVHASLAESYPGVIVESMANKIPVMTTAIAGIPELVKDGENAIVIKGNKSKDIYNAFLKYLEYRHSDYIYKIIENAYNTYVQYHTYDVVGDELESYYHWVLRSFHSKKLRFLLAKDVENKLEIFVNEWKIDKANEVCINNLWFLYHLFMILNKKDNKKIVIWGAGYWGSVALSWIQLLGKKIEFKGFIDTKKSGWYLGYEIVQNVEDVISECGTILVAVAEVKGSLEIIDYIEKFEKERNEDYFLIHSSLILI